MKTIFKNILKITSAKKLIIGLTIIFANSLSAQLDRSIVPESGPTPEIFFGKPQTFMLDNGLTVMVVENNKLPRASASLSFDNPLIFEGEIAGVSSILAEMIGNGTQSISKEDFIEEVDFMGASLNITGSGKLLVTTSFDSQELNRSVTINLIFSNSISPKITKYALFGLEKLL